MYRNSTTITHQLNETERSRDRFPASFRPRSARLSIADYATLSSKFRAVRRVKVGPLIYVQLTQIHIVDNCPH